MPTVSGFVHEPYPEFSTDFVARPGCGSAGRCQRDEMAKREFDPYGVRASPFVARLARGVGSGCRTASTGPPRSRRTTPATTESVGARAATGGGVHPPDVGLVAWLVAGRRPRASALRRGAGGHAGTASERSVGQSASRGAGRGDDRRGSRHDGGRDSPGGGARPERSWISSCSVTRPCGPAQCTIEELRAACRRNGVAERRDCGGSSRCSMLGASRRGSRSCAFCTRAADIPVEPQYKIYDEDGNFLARVDLWIDGTRRVHEYDGGQHREPEEHRRDLVREGKLVNHYWQRIGYVAAQLIYDGAGIIAGADRLLGPCVRTRIA